MKLFEITNNIVRNHNSIILAVNNPITNFLFSIQDLSTIRKENALMRMYLHVDTDKIETIEEWARLNCEMWFALKVTGKVQKNKNGKYYFVTNGGQ